jgi:tRNA pseudouridine38-40 synthase
VVEDRTPVRTVHAVRVRRQGSLVTIDVRADAFLRGMVRRMVALLLEVGRGKLNDEDVRAALAGRTAARNGAAAPARGLCLRRVALGRRRGATGQTETNEER